MNISRTRRILSWGIGWMISFIMLYQIVFAAAFRFTPCSRDHAYESRGSSLSRVAERAHQLLLVVSVPAARIAENIKWDDSFFEQLIYVPYLISIQYLVYGCIFGVWRYRRAIREIKI